MAVHVTLIGFNLPGPEFCASDGAPMTNVHVGVQRGRDAAWLVGANEHEATWELEVDVVERDGHLDFRGPVVQGKRGDRFIYLTWGEVGADDSFEMFRRAKLMLNRIPGDVVRAARDADHLVARVNLTGDDGGPRCARVDPPAITWSVPPA